MKGLILLEGKDTYEDFLPQCVVIPNKGIDNIQYMGMDVLWISDLKAVIDKLNSLIVQSG